MKFFNLNSLLVAGVALLCMSHMSATNAGEINVGLNGGYTIASDSAVADDNMYSGQLYCQYVFDGGFGIEGGYNAFGGAEAEQGVDVTTHGPYLAGSLNADLGQNLDVFARAGAMYAIAEGDIATDQHFSPFIGLGAQFAFTQNFYGRVGYDHYFNLNHNEDIRTDADSFYAGVGLNF